MGPYGGLSLRGGQQAALPLIGTWNLEDGWKEAHKPKTSSIRLSVSIEHRLVTDRHRPMASTLDA